VVSVIASTYIGAIGLLHLNSLGCMCFMNGLVGYELDDTLSLSVIIIDSASEHVDCLTVT